ncbi:CHAD domain-containing protein [Reyranella sp.]|uniref:CHAD domain-containing protein n=1 Tax=Reyranella sp. TaxID=1929291 RepID=UPI003F70F623
MTPHDIPAPAVVPPFLVSSDGIVTLSGDLALAPPEEQVIISFLAPVGEIERTPNAADVAALVGIARRLAADGFLRQMADRKFGLAGAIAARSAAASVPGKMSALDAFASLSRGCLDQVATNARLLQLSGDAEALHQCRVGLRRLRATLTAFRRILPRDDLDRWKTEAGWLAGELAAARELDALIAHVADSASGPIRGNRSLALFGEKLVLARALACDAAVEAIRAPRFTALLLDFSEWLDEAPWPHKGDAKVARRARGHASAVASEALDRLHGRLRKAGKHLGRPDPAGRHKVRIKAKKLRYAAEFFSETFGKRARKRKGSSLQR